MDARERHALLADYAAARISAVELRQRLGGATYGDILRLLADAGLPLPRAPVQGREEKLARARQWMFPKPAA
jgi:hypothetical protein